MAIPVGSWTDLLTGVVWDGGEIQVGELLAGFPVALLERSPDV
jgi:maltooligosyltrehalose synthase